MSKNFNLDIKSSALVTEDFIADVRNKFNIAFFLYKRKKSRWVTLYATVKSLTEQPVEFEDAYLKKNISACKVDTMVIKPQPNDMKNLILYRGLSILCFIVCLLVILTQATSLFAYKYTFLYLVRAFSIIDR